LPDWKFDMKGSFEQPPIIIRTSFRGSIIGFVVSAALFGGIILVLAQRGWPPDFHSYVGTYFFGMGILYFGWQLISPSTLTIAPDGLTWGTTWKSRHWTWSELDNFRPMQFGMVGCDLFNKGSSLAWMHPINKRMTGSHGSFGFGWEGGSSKVCEILAAARLRWLNSEISK
jgi:hypothetical protein